MINIHETIKVALQHYRSGNLPEAARLFRTVIKSQPQDAQVMYLLGIIYGQLGNYDSSMQYLKRSLQLNPSDANIYFALGLITQLSGGSDESIDYFQKSLSLSPNNSEACKHLGNIFKEREQFDGAVIYYQKALQIDPKPADVDTVYHNLGMSFQAKGLVSEAIECYRKAIQANPDLLMAHNNLGIVLQEKGLFEEASACYQKALLINPRSAETYYNLGVLLQRQGKRDEASAAYTAAINIRPDYVAARWARCISQLPDIYPDVSAIEAARRRYSEELAGLSGSIPLNTPQEIMSAAGTVGTQQPFQLAYQGMNDRELQQFYGELVHKIMSAAYPQFQARPAVPSVSSGDALRVGIVSGHFHFHPVWKTITKGWVENLDKTKVRLYGYYTGAVRDKETDKAKKCFDRFVDNVYSFTRLCNMIINDRLHALIYPEIGMDPVTVRLAALRLAPVQCVSWGHPDTSGLPTIDYFLSSELMEPPDGDGAYTEKLVRLPNLSIYYSPYAIPHADASREMFGLRPGSILYHCSQTLFKFLPQHDEVFPRIARGAGDCQFLFSSLPDSVNILEQFRMRICRAFSRFDLRAEDYVIFVPPLDQAGYNALSRLSQVFLDPIGWSGCTSTLEAVDCNLPIVAFPSSLMRGRESGAILAMMDVKETIASSVDDYVGMAIKLGLDSEWRCLISEKIAANKYKIYRDRACIAGLEDFLIRAVEERSKVKPDDH